MGSLPDLFSLPFGLTTKRATSTSSSSVSLQSPTSSSLPVSTSSSSSVSSSTVSSSTFSITSSISSISSISSTESIPSSSSPPAVTTVIVESPSFVPPSTNTSSNTSFLQNKVASGFVFAIVGLVGFVILMFIATFFIRRRNNQRLMRDAVSFDPVTVGNDDLEKAKQSSSVGHESHDAKSPHTYSHYSPPPLHYHGSPPAANYTPHMAAQLYAPPVRYSSPPLPPLPMQQQPSHLQRHLSYASAMSSAEEANYSRPMSDGMRGSVGPAMSGQIPDGIRRQYSTP